MSEAARSAPIATLKMRSARAAVVESTPTAEPPLYAYLARSPSEAAAAANSFCLPRLSPAFARRRHAALGVDVQRTEYEVISRCWTP